MSQALKDKLAARREARGQAPLTQNTNKVKFSQIGFLEKNMQPSRFTSNDFWT